MVFEKFHYKFKTNLRKVMFINTCLHTNINIHMLKQKVTKHIYTYKFAH